VSKGKEFRFLIDTGASFSVIKEGSVIDQKIRPYDIIFNGIAGKFRTTGLTTLEWEVNRFQGSDEFGVAKEIPIDADGILGTNFIDKYKSIIDNENFTFTLKFNGNRISLPMFTKRKFEIVLPARSETFQQCFTHVNHESVMFGNEVSKGVFVAGALVQPKEGKIWVQFLNTRETDVKIQNFQPVLFTASEFEITKLEGTRDASRVKELLNLINTTGLNSEETEAVTRICTKYSDVFQLEKDKINSTNIYKQSIRLKSDANPIYIKPYRIPQSQKSEVAKQVEQMLKNDVIEEAKSEWSSPILLVPKKAGQNGQKRWRLVIDYRRLNEQILDEKFPLANITEILDSLSGAIYFSTLDLSQGFYQLEIERKDRSCTAFVTDRGQYQMKRLPMGLKISPSAFSRMMTIAMAGLNYEKCFVYLDDVIVFGRNLDQHNKNLMTVLERLRKVNLKLNPSKCQFLRKSVLYLGHQISEQGILPDPKKIEVVKSYPTPKNADEARRFVAFANYYRKFIRNFSIIAQPLNKLSRKNVEFKWSEECNFAFEELKKKLTSPKVLDYPDFSSTNTFQLTTDASKTGLGAVLANENGRPVAYTSRVLNKQEKNYTTTEIEILAIVWALKHFRPYLYGRHFVIHTDHKPLVFLFSQIDPSSRLCKFKSILIGYNFTITYVKGQHNVVADALSRITVEDLIDLSKQINNSSILVVTRAQQRENDKKLKEKENNFEKEQGQRTDHTLDEPICEVLKKPKEATIVKIYEEKDEKVLKKYRIISSRTQTVAYVDEASSIYLFLSDSGSVLERASVLKDLIELCGYINVKEIVIMKNENNRKLIELLREIKKELRHAKIKVYLLQDVVHVTKEEDKKIILSDLHLLPTSAHAGIKRMTKSIKKYYFWSGMGKDVENFVKKCHTCQKNKYSLPIKEPMVVTSTATSALNKIFLDIVGSIQNDDYGFKYILTMQCELSKYIVAVPLRDKESTTVARAFIEHFILKYGIPAEIATDCGTEFINATLKEVCELLRIKKLQSTAYHHETIGALENTHKHLGAFLRSQIDNYGGPWSSWVSYWCFAFNTTVHSETSYTPFELVFGKNCILPTNIDGITRIDPIYNPDNYSKELKFRLQAAWKDAHERLERSKINRKNKDDGSSRPSKIIVGDWVLVKNEERKKLDPIYKGPYKVKEIEHPNIKLEVGNKEKLVHKNRIKRYIHYIN
jgi:hypothetical protein